MYSLCREKEIKELEEDRGELMKQITVTDRDIETVEDYLKSYRLNRKLLRLDRYEREYFGADALDYESLGEAPLARARMFEVRHFIMEMKNCDEKLLLYYHYVKGEKVERCAELLGVSRSSAFRMKRRALAMAAERYLSEGGAVGACLRG